MSKILLCCRTLEISNDVAGDLGSPCFGMVSLLAYLARLLAIPSTTPFIAWSSQTKTWNEEEPSPCHCSSR